MNKLVQPGRLVFCVLMLLTLLTIFIFRLYNLQIIEGAAYYEQSQNNIVSQKNVIAPRGNILDRYGRLLVSNRACNNLIINHVDLFQQEDPNAIILELVDTVVSGGDSYNDTLPITKTPPFEYVGNMSELQRTTLNAYVKSCHNEYGLKENPSAVELMAFFRTRYEIDNNYSAEEMRIIAGIRYEINSRYIVNTSDYIFSEDVSIELITRLMEGNLPGFDVEVSYIREYNTMYAAHLLGYVGQIYKNEYESDYEKRGYAMDAYVGKEGVEWAFEEHLRSRDGSAMVATNANGTVIETSYDQEPQAGNHVYLTIDIGLQEAAEQAVSSGIAQMNLKREEDNEKYEALGQLDKVLDMAPAGALVAVEVKTGEPLAIASYPTFELETFLDDYEALSKDAVNPMFNRALQGVYSPGSTFKMTTALSALINGNITVDTSITDEGVFTKYADQQYAPKCWAYPGNHGTVNLAGALEVSCNYFFYSIADYMDMDKLADTANSLGLGVHTGIELREAVGRTATPTIKGELLNEEWFKGDNLQTGIGQSIQGYTPMQLANYTAAIANSGERYKCSVLKSVRSYDYSEQIFTRVPEVAGHLENTKPEYFDAIRAGMVGVASGDNGTVRDIFGDYPVSVAAKTGTIQLGDQETNTGLFVCYAPVEDPQIAIAVVIEKGNSGSGIASIAKSVLDYYFSFSSDTIGQEAEMTLVQ